MSATPTLLIPEDLEPCGDGCGRLVCWDEAILDYRHVRVDELLDAVTADVNENGWGPWSSRVVGQIAFESGDDEDAVRSTVDARVDLPGNPHFSYQIIANPSRGTCRAECECGWISETFQSAGVAGGAWNSHVEASK